MNTETQSGNTMQRLVNETKGHAVIDSGCATNVCGNKWAMNYIHNTPEKHRENIKRFQSKRQFAFGGGHTVKSMGKIMIPCWLAGIKGYLETEIVECDIPLLLSRETMEVHKFILNFAERTVQWNGHTIKLKLTTTGHYGMPIHI